MKKNEPLADAYPLQWPIGWQRTKPIRRKWSRYRATLAEARDGLLDELRKLGAKNVVISTDMPLKRNGDMYASRRPPDDPGVAVYWTLNGQPQVIACDQWKELWENIQAVRHAIDALRKLERCGASEILSRAFQGFAALPSEAGATSWMVTLGFRPEEKPTYTDARAAWRRRSKETHPDRGGDPATFRLVQEAWEVAKRELLYGAPSH